MTISARNWAWGVAWVEDEDGVSRPIRPTEKFLLCCLAELENEDEGYAFPSQINIAARTGLSVRSIRTHISTLERSDLVLVGTRKRDGNAWVNHIYYLNVPLSFRAIDPGWNKRRPVAELGEDVFRQRKLEVSRRSLAS